jgi:zinc/manganese transport system substrate-binding protein
LKSFYAICFIIDNGLSLSLQTIALREEDSQVKKRSIILAAVISLLLLGTLGCQSPASPVNGKKSIVVTYSILGSVVKDLVGDLANVTISTPNGLDPHDWAPSAKDIETINKADLVIQNGLGLEGGLEKTLATAQINDVKFLTAADHITVRHVGQGEGIPSGDPDQSIGAADPHLWTDPLTIKSVVAALVPELQKDLNIDVSSRAVYLENRLDSLNSQISATISTLPPAERKLVTGHESMGYFSQRYGFKLIGVIVPSLSSQAEVSAADLAALKTTIEQNNVKAIFTELGTSPAVAKTIGDTTGVKVVEITTHSLPPDGSYFTFMNNLANVITGNLK